MLPHFVSIGEALTDMIRTGEQTWISKTGGAPWNVARVVASWGVPAAFAGAVSRDCFGDALAAATREARLDMRFLQRIDRSPLLAMVHETNPPRYFFVGDDSADLHFDPAQLPTGWMQSARWALFGGISLAREPLAGRLVALAESLKSSGVKIAYDPNFRIAMNQRYDPVLEQMTRLADVMKVSDEDLIGLFRSEDLGRSLAQLRAWNPVMILCVTHGERGAELHQADRHWQMTPPAVEVVDTVGAGDAFMGGLIYSLMRGETGNGAEHLAFAVASGSAACRTRGAAPPPLEDVLALCRTGLQSRSGQNTG